LAILAVYAVSMICFFHSYTVCGMYELDQWLTWNQSTGFDTWKGERFFLCLL
jgi:hypothetical protein